MKSRKESRLLLFEINASCYLLGGGSLFYSEKVYISTISTFCGKNAVDLRLDHATFLICLYNSRCCESIFQRIIGLSLQDNRVL